MRKIILYITCVSLLFGSMSCRLVDFTAVSTKNVPILSDSRIGKGVRVKASSFYFLDLGYNLKDCIDKALEKAGSRYNMLVDGVITSSHIPFIGTIVTW